MPTIEHTREHLMDLLAEPGDPLLPTLDDAVSNPDRYRDSAGVACLWEQGADKLADIHNIPHLTYTTYRNVQRHTNRRPYQAVRGDRRTKTALAAMKVVLGDDSFVDLLHDYVWVTCEETNWMLPQVDHMGIELRVPATAMDLAEIIVALADRVEHKAQERVRDEIEARVLVPYLRHPNGYHWYKGTNNWNGVINGAIGCCFLLLERDTERLARALEIVLVGLDAFLETAFEPDGSSAEGTGYWMYGLSNFICFSEMLRNRTRGAIDLLATDRLKQIATYPVDVMLSPGRYFPYSDCRESVGLEPGLVTRLIERTEVESLRGVFAEPAAISMGPSRFHTAWRNALWWDGTRPPAPELEDVWLKESDVVRLVGNTSAGSPVALAAKASHNGVSHNHNDVGGFVLHVDGESLICDPESGLYDLYRKHGHDANLFANSIGHSVPRIGGVPQSKGKEWGGSVTACDTSGDAKRVTMEIAGAYDIDDLDRLTRSIAFSGDAVTVEDTVDFSSEGRAVEEAFVTWQTPLLDGAVAVIPGDRHDLRLTVEQPEGAAWRVESFEEESAANEKSGVLRRLSFETPASSTVSSRVRIEVTPRS